VTGARRNLELKALDPDPARTLASALELGADDEGTLRQRDTYFHAVQGRLKLREAPPAAAELISYRRADRSGPKVSHYRIVPVFDPEALTQALSDALGVRTVVDKARRLLLWRGVRIHIDRVAGLGDFVELEAVSDAPGGLHAEEAKIAELRRALDIRDHLLVARGYADLLGGAPPLTLAHGG
jgi:adenylate cyclase class IV